MTTTKTTEIEWKEPAVPQHVIQMLIIDEDDKVLIMHRSNNVRSAKNVWSIPTGMHDIGETVDDCIARELYEEYGLEAEGLLLLDQYENIAGDAAPPHYHWVISIYAVYVEDVTKAVNKEPDKHDEMKFVHIKDLGPTFFENHQFHPSWHDLFKENVADWYQRMN